MSIILQHPLYSHKFMKKYKTLPPETTIHNIRTILYRIGILLAEQHTFLKDVCSCRVFIGNNELRPLNIGTNGKGRSFEYSTASGYAEFMERLQNHLLLNEHLMLTEKTFNSFSFIDSQIGGDVKQYFYDTREQFLPISSFNGEIGIDLKKLCGAKDSDIFGDILKSCAERKNEVNCVPFYSVRHNKEIFLPIQYLLLTTGSNGMASGNSYKEAILQAICEIFERYAIGQIYWHELTPPTIEIATFREYSIYDKLSRYIKESGNTVIIKDCSLGIGLPAIGLLIINPDKKLYNFKLGVDPNPEIALERCLTEIHQGRKEFQGLPYKFINLQNRQLAEDNLMKIFLNGTGFWTISILGDCESYPFKGFSRKWGTSNRSDIFNCIELINNLGYNIYIRDNSSLGFPTFYVVVPGMSQIIDKVPSNPYTKSISKLSLLNTLGRLDENSAKEIIHAIEENYLTMKVQKFELSRMMVYNTNKDLNNLSIDFLLSLLFYFVGDIKNSLNYLDNYINEQKYVPTYYKACSDYMRIKLDNPDINLVHILRNLYGDTIANEVVSDLSDSKRIFQYYNLPNCPHCDNCKLYQDCRMSHVRKIQQNIKNIESYINQQRVKEILENEEE